MDHSQHMAGHEGHNMMDHSMHGHTGHDMGGMDHSGHDMDDMDGMDHMDMMKMYVSIQIVFNSTDKLANFIRIIVQL